MSITNGYCALTDLKPRLWPSGVTSSSDTTDDTIFEQVIMAVSRQIDAYCGRRFYVNASDEKRYYSTFDDDIVFTDDIVSITSLKTDEDGDGTFETTWAATDYVKLPYNAALDGRPYTRLEATPDGDYSFPTGNYKSIEIDGKFGFVVSSAAPVAVKEACVIQSMRIFRRKDAPFGVVGSAEMGQSVVIPKLDPDVMLMLAGYVRLIV